MAWCERRGPEELAEGLALVREEGVDIHQRLDVFVAGGGVGDDRAAVGGPTSAMGPGTLLRKAARYALSSGSERSGVGNAMTG
jgi:hypothetical protein